MFLNLLKSAVLGVVAIGFPMSASAWDFAADELVYSYSNETNLKPYGTARQETYDLAVKLPDKALVGKKVVGVRIPFTTVNNLSDLSVWMTTELGIDQNDFVTNVTNICSQKAEFSNGQYIDVKFDKPYIITDEGVYVGYSFTVDKAVDQSETPIWCTSASTDEDGFWVHSSYTFRRWMSKAKETGLNLAMQVIIGGVEENSLGLLTVDLKNPAMGKSVVGEMTVQNHG